MPSTKGLTNGDLIGGVEPSRMDDGRFRPNRAKAMRGGEFMLYQNMLWGLAEARFVWDGLPETVNERYLERVLHRHGLAVFFEDPRLHAFFALHAAGTGDVDVYGDPKTFRVTGNRYINREISSKDCVPIWTNRNRVNDQWVVNYYAAALAEAAETVRVNALNSRSPMILALSQEQRLAGENFYRQVAEGQPVIFTVKDDMGRGLAESVQALDNRQSPNAISDAIRVKKEIWDDAMLALGIQSAPRTRGAARRRRGGGDPGPDRGVPRRGDRRPPGGRGRHQRAVRPERVRALAAQSGAGARHQRLGGGLRWLTSR